MTQLGEVSAGCESVMDAHGSKRDRSLARAAMLHTLSPIGSLEVCLEYGSLQLCGIVLESRILRAESLG